MIEYIRIRLKSAKHKTVEEQQRILEDIYNDGEQRGYHHTKIFAWINQAVTENISNLRSKLNE